MIATADDAGRTEQIYTYSPFGEPGQTGSSIFRYTGQVWDEETRLAYYKARYYSPKRGRFLSADPAGYVDSLNLYGYVVNDPVNLVDPSGLLLAASLNWEGNAVNLLGSVATDYVPGNQAFLNAIHSDSADAAAIFGIQAGLEVAAGFVGGGVGNTIKSAGNIALQFGKNAKGHLIKHADVLGFAGKTPQQLQKMVPELKAATTELLHNADPALTKVGQWHGHQGAKMYISNGKMIVTESNGTFITMINKSSNKWYLNAQ